MSLCVKSIQIFALVALLGSSAVLPVAEASVFQVVGESWNSWFRVDGLPWTKAYETEMIVNDRCRFLQLYSARYDVPVVAQLKHRFNAMGATFTYSTTAEGLTGIARKGNFEVSVLVSSSPSDPRHLIFLSYREPNGKKVVKEVIAPYPGSRKMSSVINAKTGSTYWSYQAKDDAVVVREYFENVLRAGGWKLMTPGESGRGYRPGVSVYQRKNKVCYIQVRQKDQFSSTITVLVKKATV